MIVIYQSNISIANNKEVTDNFCIQVVSCGIAQGKQTEIIKKQYPYFYLCFVAAGEYTYFLKAKEQIAKSGTLIIYAPKNTVTVMPSSSSASLFYIKVSGMAFADFLLNCGLKAPCGFNSVFSKKNENNFLKLFTEMQNNNICKETKLTALLLDFIAEAVREPESTKVKITGANKKLIPALEIISRDYAKNLTIEELAESCFLNKCYFIRLFKSNLGVTPHSYLKKERIKHAKQLLLDMPGETVTQIAYATGFTDLAHFRKVFTAEVGIPPAVYRRTML